eukprot:scaffold180477_cov31-Attheya_sp.AAC.1
MSEHLLPTPSVDIYLIQYRNALDRDHNQCLAARSINFLPSLFWRKHLLYGREEEKAPRVPY